MSSRNKKERTMGTHGQEIRQKILISTAARLMLTYLGKTPSLKCISSQAYYIEDWTHRKYHFQKGTSQLKQVGKNECDGISVVGQTIFTGYESHIQLLRTEKCRSNWPIWLPSVAINMANPVKNFAGRERKDPMTIGKNHWYSVKPIRLFHK